MLKRILKHLGVFLGWNVAASVFLLLAPPPLGLLGTLALALWVLHGYVLRGRSPAAPRRWAALRLRPLRGATLRWTLVATPVLLTLSWATGQVYVRLVSVPAESLNPFQGIMSTSVGRLSIAVLAVGVAPVLEEFFFRGLIQRPLERRFGAAWGICAAAAIFALVHLLPWIFPLHFFLGIAFGYIVYVTRSIWAGVMMHAANNAIAFVGMALQGEEPGSTPTLWEIGPTPDLWISLGVLLAAAVAAAWTARRLQRASRGARLRYAGLDG